jgi:hypothetical protein
VDQSESEGEGDSFLFKPLNLEEVVLAISRVRFLDSAAARVVFMTCVVAEGVVEVAITVVTAVADTEAAATVVDIADSAVTVADVDSAVAVADVVAVEVVAVLADVNRRWADLLYTSSSWL